MGPEEHATYRREEVVAVIRALKDLVPERVKGPILAELRPSPAPDLEGWRTRKKVVVALAGFYQNLGDLALTYAQKRFIEGVLPDYGVLLFPSTGTYSQMRVLKDVVGQDDIITIIGGGNMDDVYPSLENARRYVIRSFPRNPIISFPQTMAFSETAEGRTALRRTARTYQSHPDLTVFAREPQSLLRMQEALSGVRVELVPDSVLSLPAQEHPLVRTGLMLSMRSDKESIHATSERQEILSTMRSKTKDVVIRDTVDVALRDCQPERYVAALTSVWRSMSGRRVVVTDRLHGMIFCAITNTPVVVLPNSNHKIKGTYEAWLREHSYVRYLDAFDPETLSSTIDEMWDLKPDQRVGPDLSPHYEPLRRALLAAADR